MEREISSGAMLGIVLLALAAVIGLGFGVFAITKGVANDGTVQVQDSLGSVSTQVFLDYDQKIVTGTQVVSALKNFEGKPYAVLIGTKALNTAGLLSPDHDAHIVQQADGKEFFVNYNAVLAITAGGGKWSAAQQTPKGTAASDGRAQNLINMVNGSYEVTNGFAATGGTVEYDKATGGVFKTGNAEYVPTASKFQANLLKDSGGQIMGIAFLQL